MFASEPDGTARHAATGHAATGTTTTPSASPPAQAHGGATACYDHTRRRSTSSAAETHGGPRLMRRGDVLDSHTSNSLVSIRCIVVRIRG
ncbi:hypothetical protein V501_09414 [Pseudogymnoascus sp. VKM F-4519 (FW-2642)]|nr:hypothetical protein V501_09414 [Pseudogymnoascus sp. VKM F-4519 (FW-2642)]